MTRPDWDEYFISLTDFVSKRATCNRKKVGAVLVRDKRIISTGYNGSPSGQAHCTDIGCFVVPTTQVVDGKEITQGHCIRTLHAEQNAILQCAQNGIATKGSTLYVMLNPCYLCAKMIIGAGIERIVYKDDYFHDDGLGHKAIEIMRNADIKIEKLGAKNEKETV